MFLHAVWQCMQMMNILLHAVRLKRSNAAERRSMLRDDLMKCFPIGPSYFIWQYLSARAVAEVSFWSAGVSWQQNIVDKIYTIYVLR